MDKIGEVRLSDEIGERGLKRMNLIITIRFKIPTFSSVEPFFEDGLGLKKFRPEFEIKSK